MKIKGHHFEVDSPEITKFVAYMRNRFSKERFSNYFRIINRGRIDICIFQLNIRYPLPVMDLLYLEYLNRLVKDGEILQLVIISFQDHRLPGPQIDAWQRHKENVEGIFGHNMDYVTIINAEESLKDVSASELMSKDFSNLVKYISNEFIQTPLRDVFKSTVTHFSEFNQYYPEEDRLACLYYHLSRSYMIWRYLFSNGTIPSGSVVVGYLVWETEVDKLGVYHKLVVDKGQYGLCAILGTTVKKNQWEPIPNFEPAKTIYLYEDSELTVNKLNSKEPCELTQYKLILKTILRENYPAVRIASAGDIGINRAPLSTIPKTQRIQNIMDYMEILRTAYKRQRENSGKKH